MAASQAAHTWLRVAALGIRMKVAISCLCDISKSDGTIVRAKRIFEVLRKKYDCTLILRGRASDCGDIEVIRPSKLWNFQLIPVVLRNRFDIVICSNDFWGFFTYFALSKLLTCKVLLEAHGVISLEREERYPDPSPLDKVRIKMLKWREQLAVKHADCVIALSEDIYKCYEKFNKRIFIVQNFVDETKFKPQKRSRERILAEKERKNVGLIGPFIQTHDTNRNSLVSSSILDFVYENIHKFDERIHFVVIGQCDYRIANERISYTGYLSDFQDYVDQLTVLDAILVPSKFSSFGALTKVLEPMACSVPVFTTPVGLISFDHVTPGKDILVYDESELVAKVNEYLFDLDLMERVGKNARRTIEKYYSETVNSRELIAVVERLALSQ
jgi:glycosyltransferase involved in cell wall biosynthesis